MDDKQLWQLIQSMTLEEKAVLCSGADAWTTKPNRRRGIPALRMADGPHGLRVEDKDHVHENGGHSRRATCFPPEVAVAAGWSPELARQVGEAIAEECLAMEVGLLLGPGVNIKRSPLGGRNFEYYSEDPLLSGELAAGFISGVQSKGVGTSLKHYAVNNQEKLRMSVNAAVDDRALFDLYLKPFEIAVRKSKPATVMASYNRLNGRFASENRRLLTDVLRLRFGFDGAVVTDWGAVNNRPAGLAAGCDLEMPASHGVNDWAIVRAVESGMLTVDALDTACWNLLRLVFRYHDGEKTAPCNFDAHHRLAADVLAKCAVLLKNDGMLPLAESHSVAVIGEMAEKPRYQGGGSSIVNPKKLVSFLAAMAAEGLACGYAPGYRGTETDSGLLRAAADKAAAAEQVLLFLGLPEVYECEGYDREHLRLPDSQLQLLEAVTAANPNVCVVLCCGAPVEMPWLEKVRGLLLMHLGGEAVGEAALRLLYGRDNPSGKLAESWPLQVADTPCAGHFPLGPTEVTYNESLYVGYRYYDTAQKPVLFPFGFGKSYTTYEYGDLALENTALAKGEPLRLRFVLRNAGAVAGEEIAQAYLARKNPALYQPAHELKGFCRVALAAGESKQVELEIPYDALGFYDPASGTHLVEKGEYELQLGPNSRSLPLAAAFSADGETLRPRPEFAAEGYYGNVTGNAFPTREFEKIYKGKRLGNTPPRKGEYGTATPLGQMTGSPVGRGLYALAKRVGRYGLSFTVDKKANARVAVEMAGDFPFKNLVPFSRGILSPRAAEALLSLCNGQGGFFRFVASLLAPEAYRKLNRRKW